MLQQIMLYGLVFISGLIFGSFLNLVSDRVTKGKTILKGRSKCDHCNKDLSVKNLFPVISFLLQRGRCDKCKKKLSWYYPISEVLTGLTYVAITYYSDVFNSLSIPNMLTFGYLIIVASFYIIIVLTDLKEHLIPSKVVYTGIIFVLTFMILSATLFFVTYYNQLKNDTFGQYLLKAGILQTQIFETLKSLGVLILSSSAIAGFFAFLVWITKGRGMGGGDIRLGFLIGLFNGFPYNILAIILGFVSGAFVSLFLILIKKKTMKDTIAFGPFLMLGSVVAFIWGPWLINWYFELF